VVYGKWERVKEVGGGLGGDEVGSAGRLGLYRKMYAKEFPEDHQ